ncbi:antibiotic biosynthesis monooxygenase [Deinococcus multiflagellatus]|uniref:Antibiotic biosynthesis monooxygenase n=1 Tax=Deinococcus multiflagellatus TaxID=1656887 RepID=A0ABW1ZDS4_9DEIO|nr:antibiotic biosynthesis monooxygenase [Deinococcus multiflagellatus]MBZ9712740.1 antibiotic biosynthesis monooxygenase [Deinococcus multiflagellatus]
MTQPNPVMTVPSPTSAAPEGVTLVITERVRPSQVEPYETWARGVHALLAQQSGFLGLHVLRDPSGPVPEYITLLRFATQEALDAWRANPAYAAALRELPTFTASDVDYREARGLEAWFDLPGSLPAPPLWKNVLVGFVGVYPLILLFSYLCGFFTKGWPWWAAIIPSAFLATVFLNWPVLPLLSRLLRRWLYPAQRG